MWDKKFILAFSFGRSSLRLAGFLALTLWCHNMASASGGARNRRRDRKGSGFPKPLQKLTPNDLKTTLEAPPLRNSGSSAILEKKPLTYRPLGDIKIQTLASW